MDTRTTETVYAFDFDGTLTTKDTFFAFLDYAVGHARLARFLLLLVPSVIATVLHKISLQESKERLFTRCFKGMPLGEFDRMCADFARANKALLREKGIAFLQDVSRENHVLIVSASIGNYIASFLAECGLDGVAVEATVPELDASGLLTGKFVGANCKGQEKVRRIEARFPNRQDYRLIAFGDSSGDSPMLAFADEAHWKPFRD